MPAISLPVPPVDMQALSQQLATSIASEIAQQGTLEFSQFMAQALYTPNLGYYCNNLRKFGQYGDFVTAPEISPLFSYCLANQCASILAITGGVIFELGAGSGVMAADILTHLKAQQQLPEQYWILEPSATLKQRQQSYLQAQHSDYFARIIWLDTPPTQPWQGVLLANEVIDALPCQRFIVTEAGLRLQHVMVTEKQGFDWCIHPDPQAVSVSLQERLQSHALPIGYTSEWHEILYPWLQGIAQQFDRGAMLWVDYGYNERDYYSPERVEGTLLAHYQQRAHQDVLAWPGLQDLTASVNFTALADAALACGLSVAGYTTQAAFLHATGLAELMVPYESADELTWYKLSQQVQQLILPAQMGERFQVMALTRNLDIPLLGFSLLDNRHRL